MYSMNKKILKTRAWWDKSIARIYHIQVWFRCRYHHCCCCCCCSVCSDKFCDKDSGVRKVVLRGSIRNVVMAQQLIMDLVWEEMETAIGVMQFMIPDEVHIISYLVDRYHT